MTKIKEVIEIKNKNKIYSVAFLLLLMCGLSFGILFNSQMVTQEVDNVTSPKSSAGEITIITPENKTYTGPMSGYYPATYGFENDENGVNPMEWELRETGGTIDVVNSIEGHSKVVEINKDGATSWPRMRNNFSASQTSGTVEFWIRSNDVTDQSLIYLIGNENWTISFGIDNDQFIYIDSSGTYNIVSCYNNIWYHIRLDFECGLGAYEGLSADHFYIYINGERYGEYEFRWLSNKIDYMDIYVWETSVDYYYDAIGFSWDPDYNIGDNMNEGLLLSYENSTTLDWQGYSLDGTANKTILGNTTIPMPADGGHNIQVFGNDTMGTMYESNVRYFTTNALGPSVTIDSPLVNDIIGNRAPSFALTIPDTDLDDTWYSLDGGTTNIPFSGLSGTIDQTEWDKIGNGTVTIRFYANDTVNNIGQEDVTIRKDIVAPIIVVNAPTTAAEFDYTPIFDITITETNLDEFWYTIDNGANNYTISSLTGTINQAAWNSASDGPVTIRFYAKDLAGNIGTASVIVAKIPSEVPTLPPEIPGYDLYLLLGALGIISALLIRKRVKS